MKKLIGLLVIAAVAVVLVIFVLPRFLGDGPEDVAKKYMSALKDGNTETLVELSCDTHGNPLDLSGTTRGYIDAAAPYAKFLANDNYKIESTETDGDKAVVKVNIPQIIGSITLNLRMAKGPDGKWRVYSVF